MEAFGKNRIDALFIFPPQFIDLFWYSRRYKTIYMFDLLMNWKNII